MKVFKVTAALLCFVIVANALPTEEGTSVEKRSEESDFDEKRQFLTDLCERECSKLKCASSEPLPDTNECACKSCDIGPDEQDDERTFKNLRLDFNAKRNKRSTNKVNRDQSSLTQQDVEMLNRTCTMECSRLDCGSYGFDVTEDWCECNGCSLEFVADGIEEVEERERRTVERTLKMDGCQNEASSDVNMGFNWN